MNKHSELIERLKEDIDYLINREGFSELPNLTVDNIRQAITALSQGAERIEFERNLTFKYEKLSAELQSRIDELEAQIKEYYKLCDAVEYYAEGDAEFHENLRNDRARIEAMKGEDDE